MRPFALLALASLILLLCAAGCVRNKAASGPSQPKTVPAAPDVAKSSPSDTAASRVFVGDAACAGCHPQTFRDHQASRHAITFHLADRASLGKLAPTTGPLPGSKARIAQAGDGYEVRMPGGMTGPLQYALGSGKSGITFLTLMGSHVFEMRASYFPHQRQWKITPGQTGISPTALGVDHKGEEGRSCIQCHVTTLPPDSNIPEKRFFGVGCESCHGPASAHITAMQSGKTADIQMERIGTWDAKRVNDLCGTCHRNAEVARMNPGDPPDLSVTSRFQPYGLMLSRCFKESNNTLSCNTCHNPHQNTSHDMRAYEAACLNCHGGKTVDGRQKGTGSREQGTVGKDSSFILHPSSFSKACPINPRTGCVGCHMPRKPMFSGSAVQTTAPDHFIRVKRPEVEAKWARELANTPASMSMGASMGMSGK